MKHQASFSSKDKSKKINKTSSAGIFVWRLAKTSMVGLLPQKV